MCPKPFSWTKNKRKLFSDGKSRGPLLAKEALNEGGPIRNRKTVEKIIQNRKTEKNIRSKRKPHAKLSTPIHFRIPVMKTPIDPIQW